MSRLAKVFSLLALAALLLTGSVLMAFAEEAPYRIYLQEVREKVYALKSKTNWPQAEKLLIEALNNSRYNTEYTGNSYSWLYIELASVAWAQNNYNNCQKYAQQALDSKPEHQINRSAAYFWSAMASMMLKDYDRAVAEAQQAKALDSSKERDALLDSLLLEAAASQNARIRAVDLFDAFRANELKANQQFRGKTIVVTGKIAEISENINGNPQINFELGPIRLESVACVFPKSAIEKLSTLNRGDRIVVIGVVRGLDFGIEVELTGCSLATFLKP
jgi:hypothetical protein